MAKIDSIKEKINILRDDYRNMFIFFMTLLTGNFTIFYQVITLKLAVMYAFIGLLGLTVSIFTLFKMKKIKYDIDVFIDELEKIE